MPFKNTLGSFSTKITDISVPIGGYYFGSRSMPINDMVTINADTYIVGKSTSNSAYISKTNSTNQLTWTVTLTNAGIISEFINICAYNNELYVFGYATDVSNNYYPIYAKYDIDGNLIWQKKINSITTTYNCMISATMDTTGNMYMVLQTTLRAGAITVSTVQSNASTCRIIKILNNGTVDWQSQMGYLRDILATYINVQPTPYYIYNWRYFCDIYPIKIQADSSGNVYMLATRTVGTGNPGSLTSPPPTPTSISSITYTTMVVKIGSTGTLVWQNDYFIGQGYPNIINDILVDSSNNLYICGVEYQAITNSSPTFLKYNGGFTLKINTSTGAMIWHLDIGPSLFQTGSPIDTTTEGGNWKSIASDGAGNIYLAGSSVIASAGGYTNILLKIVDPGTTTPTVISYANQNDASIHIKLLRGRIYINDGLIISSWPISGGLPNPNLNWPTLPLTYGGTFASLIIYNMTGGSNPASYWRVLALSFGTGGGISLSSSTNTLTAGTMSPSQTLVYFK